MQRRTLVLAAYLGVLLIVSSDLAAARYQLHNLVSNRIGQAKHIDPLLVNAWD